MVPLAVTVSFLIGSVMAAEMVSRIVVPLPKLMKYSEAAGACEAEGMRLVRFSSAKESLEYATATLLGKNLDRVWIGAVGEDVRERLALQVFEGLPITYKIEQIYEEDKMLAVLCEPIFMNVKSEPIGDLEDFNQLALENVSELAVSVNEGKVEIQEAAKESEEIVICKFEVDSEEKSVQIINDTEVKISEVNEGNKDNDVNVDIDLIKSKGNGRREYERLSRSRCSRSRRSSSSSSSSECERSRRRNRRSRRNYRRNRRGRRCSRSSTSRSSRCSSSSSSSSSECAVSDFSCDPFERTSSSSSESRCRRSDRKFRRRNRKSRCSRSSSSTSSSSSSSSELCGTGRCGAIRGRSKFFREIRISH